MKQRYIFLDDPSYWHNFQDWCLEQNTGIIESETAWDMDKNALLMNKLLKKFRGCLLYVRENRYNSRRLVVGIEFRSEIDLVHFKLKFT